MSEPLPKRDASRSRLGNIYLIGPMGSGKTTLGRRIARRLNLEFVDCDLAIEEQTGASVNLIFDIEGEKGFRERERALLAELAGRHGLLVATGGGIVTDERNRSLLRETGYVVWLKTSVQQQLDRLSRDRTRPLLQASDRRQRLEQLAAQRNPLYGEIADLVFESSQCDLRRQAVRLSEDIRRSWHGDDPQPAGETP